MVELGPGNGTLMGDILKVMQRFHEERLTVHLIEISDNLIDTQEKLLCGSVSKSVEGKSYVRKSMSLYGVTIYWHKDIGDIPDGVSNLFCCCTHLIIFSLLLLLEMSSSMLCRSISFQNPKLVGTRST